MITKESKIIVVGGGIFGVGGAIELFNRGYKNIQIIDSTLDKGPNPIAASTDISKIIRSDYGNDEDYTELHTESLRRWREWNKKFGEELFHETGLLVLSKERMAPGTFVYDSFQTLKKFGYSIERITPEILKSKYSKWSQHGTQYKDGYFNKQAGWAESGRVLGRRIQEAKQLGIELISSSVQSLLYRNSNNGKSQVYGVQLTNNNELYADLVLVCAGAWTPILIPKLENTMLPVAQPVFHFEPKDLNSLKDFQEPNFTTYVADIQSTGIYGFASHPHEKCMKVGHHGLGYPLSRTIIDKDSLDKKLKSVMHIEETRIRKFIEGFSQMKESKTVYGRLCMYCDSFDGNFFIGPDPDTEGLAVAAGGSGHGFKFAPVIGEIIADSVEGKVTKFTKKFQWRVPTKERMFDVCRSTIEEVPKAAL